VNTSRSRRLVLTARTAVSLFSLAALLSEGPSVAQAMTEAERPATAADARPGATPVGIQSVAWLAGCWELSDKGRTVEEQWMAPRGKNMIGMGRTLKGEALVEFEHIVLREEEGRLAYEAHPSGQPSAVFTSKLVGDGSVVFENLEHDFPQRVGYDRKGDALTGWVEGTKDGKTRRMEFPYKRVPCPGR